MGDCIRFILNGTVEEVRVDDPTLTVLEYLRDTKGLTGTKEGCNEGDCGACTVVIAEPCGTGLRYRAVNSCIQFLPTLDGKQLITVEDLPGPDGELHPVQQALVDHHGSQCGFCTPGFVMSLFAMFHELPSGAPARGAVDRNLAGNLCRCTGYAPIVRAAQAVLDGPRNDRFTQHADEIRTRLLSLQPAESVATRGRVGAFQAPASLDELCRALAHSPDAVLLAGGTDIGLWVTKQLRSLDQLIYVGRVPELLGLHMEAGELHIGAAVTYADAEEAVTALYPAFAPLLDRLGAVQVRNVGTIGGNIANGSPIGDMPPGLIAAGSRLVLCSSSGRRTIDLEDFFLAYGEQDLRPGECVERIVLPPPAPGSLFGTYKVSKRREQDISAVCGGYAITLRDGLIEQARICYGGMAATPKRATACELALQGKPWERATIDRAMAAMDDDYEPITDVRAGADYRMRVARNLLLRFFLEHDATPGRLRLGEHRGAVTAHV
jgi:xanthine dehydrogenase small subunit